MNINYGNAKGLGHKVVATDCKFPKECYYQSKEYMNNTIICRIEGCVKDRLFVVCHKFLQSIQPTHTIIIDGKTIELSHESFLNLRSQLL